MTHFLEKKYNAIHDIFREIRITDLPIEYWKIKKEHFYELREPMIVLFTNCENKNEYGGCLKEQFLTVGYFENAHCDLIPSEIIDESEWFYVLHAYPLDINSRDLILQKFFHLQNDRLKYPIEDPFQNKY